MKSVTFAEDDVEAMERGLTLPDLSDDDALHLHFALGKGYEDRGEAEPSFGHYRAGNALRRDQLGYEADATSRQIAAMCKVFDADFFDARTGWGCPSDAPIFIVGLPRAGSTLIEQILASHSSVEGTMELPDLPAIAAGLGSVERWPDRLTSLGEAEVRELGERYLERTRIVRKTDRPHFIDKLPNNWAYAGLIRLILPKARIIDARRHPMACCFSNFKQHFARGQSFSYGLTDIGRYYADYVAFMAHMDDVQPGHLVRLFHEDMVDDSEREIRRLLDALDFPFEESCLRFWENDRAVRTASSEQVRRPIFKDGTEQWRMFEPHLDELKAALGPVLTAYPAVP